MKKEKIYSLKEMKELKCSRSRCYEHENGNYSYKKGFEKWHLIINGKDALEGLEALELHYYNVNDYAYKTAKSGDFYLNLVINGSISEIHFPYESDIYLERYHGNGSYSYLDSDEYFHLVIDGVDVLEGLEAEELDYYCGGVYSYTVYSCTVINYSNKYNKHCHLIINGVDILKDKEAKWCNYFEDGTYYYCGNDGVRMIINGKNVLEGLKVSFCSYHGNGVYSYEDKKEYKHLIVNGKDVLEGKEAVILWKYENGVCHYTNKDKNDLFLEIK
tara:strand:+ start:12 stop:830 length:819 start_codon:yes stop_codon:yes gene_type:complete